MYRGWWILNLLLYLAYGTVVTPRPPHSRVKRDSDYMPEENLNSSFQRRIEGDILLPQRKNAVRNVHQTWVNRIVPFVIGQDLGPEYRDMVLQAMREIENKSCVRFINHTIESDYINVVKETAEGCFSHVGRLGHEQFLYLADSCYEHGVIVHELMHALGFWHEHSRPDRDEYISIIWNNIDIDHRANFDILDDDEIDILGAPYDYGSIMHYRNNTFAIDPNHITINHTHPLPPGVEMGQRIGLSEIDVLKLKRLYKCNITACPRPRSPQNGIKVLSSTQVGATVSYACNNGYRLYGSRRRFCLDQGNWTGRLPLCLPDADGALVMCDFDNHTDHFCGWNSTTDVPWILHSGATPTNGTGPEEDHTLDSDEGFYIYLEASDKSSGQQARLLSPPLNFTHTGPICLMFYYSMYGHEMGTLNVYQQALNSEILLFNKTGDQGNKWKKAVVTLHSQDVFQVMLEAVVGGGYHSDIAVDDLVIGPCYSLPITGAVPDTFRCSFDIGWCGLQQDRESDDFDWRRISGETRTHGTGPDCDFFNCLSGRYIYIESSWPRRRRDNARLITPVLHGEGNRCVEFMWHMRGNNMGSLTLKLRQQDSSELTVWSRSGHQGNEWHVQQLDILHAPKLYQLMIEGTVGQGHRSDAAFDNLEIFASTCDDVVYNNCTFQRSMCHWQNVGQIQWQRNYGNTPTPNTGPTLDHNNSSTNYYLYVETSRTFPNQTARLRSGIVKRSQAGHCLRFWYHMLGSDVGMLSVGTNTSSSGQERTLWYRSGEEGDVWHRHAVSIGPQDDDFRIFFETRLAGGGEGDIAIDDISVQDGQCGLSVQLSGH